MWMRGSRFHALIDFDYSDCWTHKSGPQFVTAVYSCHYEEDTQNVFVVLIIVSLYNYIPNLVWLDVEN